MKSKPNYTRLVQEYLTDELSMDMRNSFENELKTNEFLAEELAFQRKLNNAILDDELENFKIGLDAIHQKLTKKSKPVRKINFNKLSLIAASVIILIAIGAYLISQGGNSFDSDKIFEKYYQKYASVNVTRDQVQTENKTRFKEALLKYEHNQFTDAQKEFESLTKNEPDNIGANFYLGIVYIESDHFSKAIDQFEKVIKSNDQFYCEQAGWYKALCLLKLKQKRAAFNQLNSIIEGGGYYRSQAQEVVSFFDSSFRETQ